MTNEVIVGLLSLSGTLCGTFAIMSQCGTGMK